MKIFITRSLAVLAALLFCLIAQADELFVVPPPEFTPDVVQNIMIERAFLQPIVWVGKDRPDDAESKILWDALMIMRAQGVKGGFPLLEKFVADHPASPWTPSVRANLAHYYRFHGRITLALEHWEVVWNALKDDTSERGKWIADFTIAHWTRLLASLGRYETLRQIFTDTKNRFLDGGYLQQMFTGTKEAFLLMKSSPGVSYKCGTFALANTSDAMGIDRTVVDNLLKIPSPPTGFSLDRLKEIADSLKLDLVPVERGVDETIVVPSVVHWKQDHYGAILKENNGAYLIVDPTFEESVWITAETLNAEASGRFLVPANTVPATWKRLTQNEASTTSGKGFPLLVDDSMDESCSPTDDPNSDDPDCQSPMAGFDPNSDSSTPPSNCGPAENPEGDCGENDQGMARWRVSEPFINLWIRDTPLFYSTSYGKLMSLKLAFKQRNTRPVSPLNPVTGGFGPGWEHNWLSYVEYDNSQTDRAVNYVVGGGRRTYRADRLHKRSRSFMCGVIASSGGGGTGFVTSTDCIASIPRIFFQSMGTNEFNISVGYSSGQTRYFLTKKTDRWGRARSFSYTVVTSLFLRINTITDPDGKQMTFNYDAINPDRIISVSAEGTPVPQATFGYGTTGFDTGKLVSITDAGNLQSSFTYDANGWITSMATPYGTTQFGLFGSADGDLDAGPPADGNDVKRAIQVTEPDQKKQLFIYRNNSTKLNDTTGAGLMLVDEVNDPEEKNLPDVPDTITGSTTNSLLLPNLAMHSMNSYHWGRLQFAQMNTSYAFGNLDTLTTIDYHRARRLKWLEHPADGVVAGNTLGFAVRMRAEPSQLATGLAWGQRTWYGYDLLDDQGSLIGPTSFPPVSSPSYIGRKLADGTSQWVVIKRTTPWWLDTDVFWGFSDVSGADPTQRSVHLNYDTTQSGGASVRDLLTIQDTSAGTVPLYTVTYKPSMHLIDTATLPTGEKRVYSYTGSNLDKIVHQNSAGTPFLTNTFTRFSSGTHSGWVDRRVDFGIATNSYTYNNGSVATQTDPLVLTRTFTRDGLLRVTRIDYPTVNDFEQFTFTKLDLTTARDRLGKNTTYAYDAVRQLTQVTDRAGKVTKIDFCDCGSPSAITEGFGTPLALTTTFTYDNQGNRLNVTRPLPDTVSNYQRDPLGRITRVTQNPGDFRVYYHPTGTISNINAVISGTEKLMFKGLYDSWDRLTNVVDGSGTMVTNQWDKAGRLLVRGLAALPNSLEQFQYSERGLVGYIDQLGINSQFQLDALGRRITETIAFGTTDAQVNQYTFDPVGNLIKLLDGRLRQTSWIYDNESHLLQKKNHNGAMMVGYGYDANHRVTLRTNALDNVITQYLYDEEGRLRVVDYPAGAAAPDLHYTYDALGRLSSAISSNQFTCNYAYNAGKMASEGGLWADDWVAYAFTDGLPTGLSLFQPNATFWFEHYAIDPARRLQTVSLNGQPLATYGYRDVVNGANVAGTRVQTLALANTGLAINYSYDAVARLINNVLTPAAGPVLDLIANSYNIAHQRTRQERTAGDYVDYTYDNRGQLKTALASDPGGTLSRAHEQFSYTYDLGDNLSTRSQNGFVQTFAVGNYNQLTSVTRSGTLTVAGGNSASASSVTVNTLTATRYADNTFSKTGFSLVNGNNTFTAVATDSLGRSDTTSVTVNLPTPVSFTRDLNGNMTSDGRRTFVYNEENQLTSVSVAGQWKSDSQYDARMRRRVRKEYIWQNSDWVKTNEVRYVYDGMRVVQERDANNLPRVTYTWGKDLSGSLEGAGGIGGLLARTDNTLLYTQPSLATAYYHADAGGNITALVNGQGALVAKYLYDPFGNLIAKAGLLADANTMRFSSKEYHENSGLYYYGYRFYEPNLQRWLNRDPLGEEGGVNLYGFVGNDPINWIDPDGLQRGPARGPGRGGGRSGPLGPRSGVFQIPWQRPPTKSERDAFLIACLRNRLIENQRRQAVEEAWKQEQELVCRTGQGTRRWTESEIEELVRTGSVKGYHGHHMNSVSLFPEQTWNPNNIVFRTPPEHFGDHNFNWRTPTMSFRPVNRTPWIR